MKRISFLLLALAAVLTGCSKKQAPVHPEWTYGSVVYEVNIRQFSPEGTFKGVEAQLPRLKDLGVDVLWLMPMYEIGTVERKGTLGSYYAISTVINKISVSGNCFGQRNINILYPVMRKNE